MAIKKILEDTTQDTVNVTALTSRGETCQIKGVSYFIRYPRAKDMINLEKLFADRKASSSFEQALLMVQELSDNDTLTYEFLEDLYLDELTEVLELFQKLLPTV